MRNQNPKLVYMNIANTHTPEMRYKGEGDFTHVVGEFSNRFYAQKGYKVLNEMVK